MLSLPLLLLFVSGLILAYGIIVIIGGTVDLAGASNGIENAPDIGGSDGVFPPIVLLLAQLTVTLFGLVSTFLGFQVCVRVCVVCVRVCLFHLFFFSAAAAAVLAAVAVLAYTFVQLESAPVNRIYFPLCAAANMMTYARFVQVVAVFLFLFFMPKILQVIYEVYSRIIFVCVMYYHQARM